MLRPLRGAGAELAFSSDRTCGSEVVIRARRLATDNFVEIQIGSPKFRVRDICAVFNMSRASLYHHFPKEGGIARAGSRAVRELAMHSATRGQISAAAERWGFSDVGDLHRLVNHKFRPSLSELASRGFMPAGRQATPRP